MEDEDPQLVLERQVDELFKRSDALAFFIMNQIVECITDRYTDTHQQEQPQSEQNR